MSPLTDPHSALEYPGGHRTRPVAPADHSDVLDIILEVLRAGATYPYPPETTREEAAALWLQSNLEVFVVEREGAVLGHYYLKPNQPGLGSHVANAGYMVAERARGQGLGRLLGEDSLRRAPALGFRAMQFNLVVADNHAAIALWKSLGFVEIGRLPSVFHKIGGGDTDALVMHRHLAAK